MLDLTRREFAAGALLPLPPGAVADRRKPPRQGDVAMSFRFPQATAWSALAAYRPDRVEWHYASEPAFVARLKASPGVTYVSGAINANVPLSDPSGYARDFDGEIIVAPWMTWGAQWVTAASPVTRAALLEWADRTMATGVDGLQVDDGWFGWQSEIFGAGDFSASSLAGFGPWLARAVPAAKLQAVGLRAGAGFNYRDWLKSQHGIASSADYRARRGSLPSTPLWRRYLADQTLSFWSELRARVSGLLSMNFGALAPNETFVGLAHRLDYTMNELPIQDEPWRHALYGATAEAARLPHVACFQGRAPIARLRQMIASAYACDIIPVAPWDVWVPSEGDVTQPRFSPDPAAFTDLYDFVRSNRGLFDGWGPAGGIGLLVPAQRYRPRELEALVQRFVAANAPFRILLCDSEYREVSLGARELAGLSGVALVQPAADYTAQSLAAVAGLRIAADPERFRLGRVAHPDWRLAPRRRGGKTLFHLIPAHFGAAAFQGGITLTGTPGPLRVHRPGAEALVITPAARSGSSTVYSLPRVVDWAILEPVQ